MPEIPREEYLLGFCVNNVVYPTLQKNDVGAEFLGLGGVYPYMSKQAKKFKAGTRVRATYRVHPFLAEETLVVVSTQGERCYVQAEHRRWVAGWLYSDTLVALPREEYKIELANKIDKGRAVGNLYGVGRYINGCRHGWALQPQECHKTARTFADAKNSLVVGE